jgi:protein phosphatase
MDVHNEQGAPRQVGVVTPDAAQHSAFDLALATDIGTERDSNEDAFGYFVESPSRVIFAVADGVGGYEGGEVASRMAIDATLAAYRASPTTWGVAKRLARAVQRANIEIHDRTLVVDELRRMATTLTAAAVFDGMLTAVHVGDCRLFRVRDGSIQQLTKDHTVLAARVRLGLLAKEDPRTHPERGTLTRCLGPELIAAVDRFATPLAQGDVIVIASDGLYVTLSEDDIATVVRERSAREACQMMIELANRKGTSDNLTAAVFRQTAPVPEVPRAGLRAKLEALLGAKFFGA